MQNNRNYSAVENEKTKLGFSELRFVFVLAALL